MQLIVPASGRYCSKKHIVFRAKKYLLQQRFAKVSIARKFPKSWDKWHPFFSSLHSIFHICLETRPPKFSAAFKRNHFSRSVMFSVYHFVSWVPLRISWIREDVSSVSKHISSSYCYHWLSLCHMRDVWDQDEKRAEHQRETTHRQQPGDVACLGYSWLTQHLSWRLLLSRCPGLKQQQQR